MRAYDLTISGSLLISGSGKFGDGSPIISSSGQLASDISGSFTQTSTSLASRISTAETELDLNLVSGSAQVKALLPTKTVSSSAQIASDISGSFTTLSASVSTRLAAEEAEAEGTVVSSSAQIAIDISGSLGTNATLIRSLTATGVSGSFISVSSSLASRIAAEEAEAEGTVVSSSAQIASDISGSFNKSAVSASFALKKAVTGSFALKSAVSASFAQKSAVSASFAQSTAVTASLRSYVLGAALSGSTALVSGSKISTGSFGRVEVGQININGITGIISASYVGMEGGSRFKHSQSLASTWTISHNLNEQYPNITVYNADDEMILPTTVTATDVDTTTLTFSTPVSGHAMVSTGGHSILEGAAGNTRHSQTVAATNWRVTHSLGEQYPSITVYDGDDNVIIPERISATNARNMDIFFTDPTTGTAFVTIGSGTSTTVISSSAQFADDISGSWSQQGVITSSAQIATDISGSLGSNATLIRSLTAVGVSGSFTELSTSLASRIAAEEVEAEGTVVSSSAQIATDISGSLGTNATLIRSLTAVGVSGSLGTNASLIRSLTATGVSGSLGSNATLIRSLTAVGVSGSFISVSSSLASRIAAEEAEAEGTVVSSSAQIATDISGSLGANASLIRSLTAVGVSGSLGTNGTLIRSLTAATISGSYLGQGVVTSSAQIATDISGSLGANASLIRSLTAAAISGSVVAGVSGSALSTGSFGRLEVGGSSNLSGDLTVGGRLTAQEFHTEFVSSSIMFQSGSTKFGDSAADTHTFTGKMEISGSQAKVSASVGATGSFGHLFLAKGAHITDRLYFSDVGGEYISGDGTDLNLTSGADINIPSGIGLTFGNDGEKIEGNGTKLDIAAAEIDFSIEGSGDINIGADIGLTFGNDGEKIEGNGTRMSIASGTGMVLDCEGDVEINADGGVIDFKDDSAYLLKVSSTKVSGSAASTGSFGRIEGSVFSGSFIGKGTFNNIDDPTAMAIALG